MARQDCCADRQTNCRALLWLQDRALAQEWAAEINAVIRQSPRRPRTLLVLLNPFGGMRKARSVWRDIALPVFELAGGPDRHLVPTNLAVESVGEPAWLALVKSSVGSQERAWQVPFAV